MVAHVSHVHAFGESFVVVLVHCCVTFYLGQRAKAVPSTFIMTLIMQRKICVCVRARM